MSALTLIYNVSGTMAMTNSQCNPATCNVAVTGAATLDDDLGGNVTLTSLSLSHAGYEVATPALVSIVITRTSITNAASVLGTGTTVLGATNFGSGTLNQTGSIFCTPGLFACAIAGFADGANPLPPNPTPSPTALGTWTFDASSNFTTAPITYTNVVTPQPANETLTLSGTLIPEPGTGLLMAVGLLGMALRRRAAR